MTNEMKKQIYDILKNTDSDEKDNLYKAIDEFYARREQEEETRKARIEEARMDIAIAMTVYLEALSGEEWNEDLYDETEKQFYDTYKEIEPNIEKLAKILAKSTKEEKKDCAGRGSCKCEKDPDDVIRTFLNSLR